MNFFLDENSHIKASKFHDSLIFQDDLREVIIKISEMAGEYTTPLLIERGDATRNLNELLSNEFLRHVYHDRDESIRLCRGVDEALRKCGFDASEIASVTGTLPSNTSYTDFKSQMRTNHFFRQYGLPNMRATKLALDDAEANKKKRFCLIKLSVPYVTSLLKTCPLVHNSERAAIDYRAILRNFVFLSNRREVQLKDWPHLSEKDIRGYKM